MAGKSDLKGFSWFNFADQIEYIVLLSFFLRIAQQANSKIREFYVTRKFLHMNTVEIITVDE